MKAKEIKTRQQLDEAMFNVAQTTADIQRAEADFQKKLDEITKRRETILEPIQAAKDSLERSIEVYVKANRADLFAGDSKTLKTPYGVISFKNTSDKLVIDTTEEDVIKKIKHSFKYLFNKNYRSAVTTRYVLVKEVLKQIPDNELEVLGVHKSSEEKMYIKPDLSVVKA